MRKATRASSAIDREEIVAQDDGRGGLSFWVSSRLEQVFSVLRAVALPDVPGSRTWLLSGRNASS